MISSTTAPYVLNNTIYLFNVKGKTISLYDIKGDLYDQKVAEENNLQLTVQHEGVFLVVVDEREYKVVVW